MVARTSLFETITTPSSLSRVLDPSVGLNAVAAAAVFLIDAMLWRDVVRLFNRERLLTARATARWVGRKEPAYAALNSWTCVREASRCSLRSRWLMPDR